MEISDGVCRPISDPSGGASHQKLSARPSIREKEGECCVMHEISLTTIAAEYNTAIKSLSGVAKLIT